MRTLLFALALVAAPAAAQNATPDVSHLIGRPYAGLPGGWGGVGGSVLEASPDGEMYILSRFESVRDRGHLFVYSRVDQMIDDRYPVSTILAALAVPDVAEGEIASSYACSVGPDEPTVVVVGEQTLDEADGVFRYGPVRLAWALDREAEQFVPVDADRVTCIEEGIP
ncbi:MAG: hypothetical protein AAF845_04820 [Bacteroidota bacterium]